MMIATASMISFAQKKTSTSATIAFDASTAIDDLPKAENKTAIAAIDPEKNTVQFEAAIKNFAFSNPSIQDHFNQKGWMNSDEFPKATFNGVITNPTAVNFKKDGTYNVTVEGDLTLKGINTGEQIYLLLQFSVHILGIIFYHWFINLLHQWRRKNKVCSCPVACNWNIPGNSYSK